jgi:hypothetical protein
MPGELGAELDIQGPQNVGYCNKEWSQNAAHINNVLHVSPLAPISTLVLSVWRGSAGRHVLRQSEVHPPHHRTVALVRG